MKYKAFISCVNSICIYCILCIAFVSTTKAALERTAEGHTQTKITPADSGEKRKCGSDLGIDGDLFPAVLVTQEALTPLLNEQTAHNSPTTNDTNTDSPKTIELFFSPTCTHCSHFFQELLKNNFTSDYIANGKVRFWIRPYCVPPQDFAIAQISYVNGEENFARYMLDFVVNHEKWIGFCYLKPDETKQKQKFIDDMITKLNLEPILSSLTRDEKIALNIVPENILSTIYLYALSMGITAQQIINAITGPNSASIAKMLLRVKHLPLDEKGECISAVPAFYINKFFQGALTMEKLKDILDGKKPMQEISPGVN